MAISGLAAGLGTLGHRVRFPGKGAERGAALLPRLLFNLGLPRRVRRPDPDLVVGFDLDGFAIAGRTGVPYVLCLKGIIADELRFESGLARPRLALMAALERRNARRADVVVVPSDYSREVAARSYGLDPARVGVVPEGIDLPRWERDNAGSDAHGNAGPPTVLSVARQYARKNTATLLRAFRRVLAASPEARLRVVGGGPELPRLRRLTRELGLAGKVTLLGELPGRSAVREEYRRADVFCLPTLQEGFGIVFLEAMASGLPVVASSVAAVPEVVPHGKAGLLVDPRDPDAVGGAILRLLESEALRSRLGAAGRRHARRFAWPRVAEAFLRTAGLPTASRGGPRPPGS